MLNEIVVGLTKAFKEGKFLNIFHGLIIFIHTSFPEHCFIEHY